MMKLLNPVYNKISILSEFAVTKSSFKISGVLYYSCVMYSTCFLSAILVNKRSFALT